MFEAIAAIVLALSATFAPAPIAPEKTPAPAQQITPTAPTTEERNEACFDAYPFDSIDLKDCLESSYQQEFSTTSA